MKRRKYIIFCGAAALAFAMTGCGTLTSQGGYTGAETAKAVSLNDTTVSGSDATLTADGLVNLKGSDYNNSGFVTGELTYEYESAPITGVIASENNSQSSDSADIAEAAKAADTAGGKTASSGSQSSGGTDTTSTSGGTATSSGGSAKSSGGTGTSSSGSTKSSGNSSTSGQTTSESSVISESKAKQIALNHAGLTSSQVTYIKCKLDRDDGQQVYEIEFYTGSNKEYDYEINASTGTIISYKVESHGSASSGGSYISADEAKKIALAKVSGATTGNIREFEADYDDGRLEYEGKIIYGGMEYEFTIDGYSGTITEWEVERWD